MHRRTPDLCFLFRYWQVIQNAPGITPNPKPFADSLGGEKVLIVSQLLNLSAGPTRREDTAGLYMLAERVTY